MVVFAPVIPSLCDSVKGLGESRIRNVMQRVSQLSDDQVQRLLRQVKADFCSRHQDMESVLRENYEQASLASGDDRQHALASKRKLST
jgi:hypothetical protein